MGILRNAITERPIFFLYFHLLPPRGPTFSLWELSLQAAIAGQGVALGRSALVEDYLKSGQLVKPFRISSPSEFGYYLVCQVERAQEAEIAAFRAWIKNEAAGTYPAL